VTNVNFSVSVGTVVPRAVSLHTVSAAIVDVVPQYRGYSYFVTRDQIVIVEPSTSKIVTVVPYQSGGSTVAAPAPARTNKPAKFTKEQREVIRKQVTSRPSRSPAVTGDVVIGREVPSTIIVEEFPETVYREVPDVRTYRYYRTERNVVVVDPDRRIVDIID